MKISSRETEQFVKQPNLKCRAILVYGPDEGLVRVRAKTICQAVVEDLQDPFNVVEIISENLQDDPTKLNDELVAISMMGGRRLIRVRDAIDKITDALNDALNNDTNTDNVIVLEAGDLKPSSKLRKLCEKQDNAAVIACYAEDARDLSKVIFEMFSKAGLTIDSQSMQILATRLLGDRAMAVQTAEKIITYIGQDRKNITLEDIMICAEDSSTLFMNDLVSSAMSGNIEKSNILLHRLMQDGIPAVAICRSFQNYLNRLALAKAHVSNGETDKTAMTKLKPPVFFKEHQSFIQNMRLWSLSMINTISTQLMETEAICKTTAAPDNILCDRLVFRIAHMGRRLAGKRK